MPQHIKCIKEWTFDVEEYASALYTTHLVKDRKRNAWFKVMPVSNNSRFGKGIKISLIDTTQTTEKHPYKYELCAGSFDNILVYDHYLIKKTYGNIFILDINKRRNLLRIECEKYGIKSGSHFNDHAMIIKDNDGMTKHIIQQTILKTVSSIPEEIVLLIAMFTGYYDHSIHIIDSKVYEEVWSDLDHECISLGIVINAYSQEIDLH